MRADLLRAALMASICTAALSPLPAVASSNSIDTSPGISSMPFGIEGTEAALLTANGFGFGETPSSSIDIYNTTGALSNKAITLHTPTSAGFLFNTGDLHIENYGGGLQIGGWSAGTITIGNPGTQVTVNGAAPDAPLSVNGEIKLGSTGLGCDPAHAGTIRYVAGTGMQYCSGALWTGFSGNQPILIGGCMSYSPPCPAGYVTGGTTTGGKYGCDEYGPNVWVSELCVPE